MEGHALVQCPHRAEEGIGSLGAGMIGGCEPPEKELKTELSPFSSPHFWYQVMGELL